MLAALIDEAPRFFTSYNIVFIGEAFLGTLGLSLAGASLGFAIGFVLATLRAPRVVGFVPARLFAVAFVELFRRVPFLVALMCIFFAYQLAGAKVTMFTVALTTVTLSAAAFAAEIVRAGFESVHRNQLDAADAMNFGRLQLLVRVIIPQSWRVIVPPLFSYAIGFIKSTSIASQIGVLELTYAAKVMNTKGFSAVLCFGTVLLLYFLVCYPTNLAGHFVERRLAAARRR